MSEEEVGQEFDRVIRAAMTSLGQIREHMSRRAAERDRQSRDAAAVETRAQEEHTARVLDAVKRPEFWDNANGERVANAATYGATLYNTDRNAAEIYDTVRDQSWQRWGINVDALRAESPESEEARRNALAHAVDDRLAAARDDAIAAQDRAAAADIHRDAEQERDVAHDDRVQAGGSTLDSAKRDARGSELDHEARGDVSAAHGVEQARDHERVLAGADAAAAASQSRSLPAPATAAGRAQQQLSTSYPRSAKETLAAAGSTRQSRPTTAVQRSAPHRSRELSR